MMWDRKFPKMFCQVLQINLKNLWDEISMFEADNQTQKSTN